MPSSTQRRRKGRGETIPPLSKLDVIDKCLKVQTETFPQKELTPEEIDRWHRDLSGYPVDAIEWSFENWRKSGTFFPVPSDILDALRGWEPTVAPRECSTECRSRHGKGYHLNDIMWLWSKREAMNVEVLDEAGWEQLFSELDAKRLGGAPQWRR